MLKKDNRIRKNKEFDRVFEVGQTFYSKDFNIRAVDNGMEQSRLGVIASTKVSKKAVLRNLAKRWIKKAFQDEKENIIPGKDLVVVIFDKILDKNFQDIHAELVQSFKNLKIYKKIKWDKFLNIYLILL